MGTCAKCKELLQVFLYPNHHMYKEITKAIECVLQDTQGWAVK